MFAHRVVELVRWPDFRSNEIHREEKTRGMHQFVIEDAIDLLSDDRVDRRDRCFESIESPMNFSDVAIDVQTRPSQGVKTCFECSQHLTGLFAEQRVEGRIDSRLKIVETCQKIFQVRFVMFKGLFLKKNIVIRHFSVSSVTFCMQSDAALGMSTSNR